MEWVRTLEFIGLAYSSRFRLFWLVKSILHCAVEWGVLPDNRSFASANRPAKPTRAPILLDSSEGIRLLDVLRDFPHRAAANAIQLMLLTCRPALGIGWHINRSKVLMSEKDRLHPVFEDFETCF